MREEESLLKSKILYTCIIVIFYLLGKGFPLYMIDVSAYVYTAIDAESLLIQTISGDINQCSIFALGVSPYMISSIIVQIYYLLRGTEAMKKVSPIQKNRLILKIMFILSVAMAVVTVQELKFAVDSRMLPLAKCVAAVELVTGTFIMLHLVSENAKYGLGGQSVIIFMNILDGFRMTLEGQDVRKLVIPLLISFVVLIITLILENAEKRIPVQRISIHNIYADKNYIAIKLNPIGVMPAMFSTAFFMLLQLILVLFGWLFTENDTIVWLQENVTLTNPVGIAVYALLIFILTIGFSWVMLNPTELTENFLKSGDSIQNLHAGRDTKRYLSGVIFRLGLLSATVMCICLCTPLILHVSGRMNSAFTTLPSSVMLITGVWSNLYREVLAIKDIEAYKPFI